MKKTPLKILFYDEAVAYGGTISLLKLIFSNIDRTKVKPSLISALPVNELAVHFDLKDITCTVKPKLTYVAKAKLNNTISSLPLKIQKLFFYSFSCLSFLLNTPTLIKLSVNISKNKPDIIHINNSYPALLIAQLYNIPSIWHIHGIPSKPPKLYSKVFSRCNLFLSISKFIELSAIEAGIPREKLVTIHNPAPPTPIEKPSIIHKQLNLPPETVIISHIGRLIKWKGQLEFLQAITLIQEKIEHCHIAIIGDDTEQFGDNYKQQLKQLVAQHGLEGCVSFLGHVPNPIEYLKSSDIVVHSSLEPEPFGLVITEAMCCGAAVICSDKGAGPEIITDGINGFTCPPTDTKMLSEKILLLTQQPDMRKKIAAKGAQHVRDHFSVERYCEALITIYLNLTQPDGTPPL
jgi:glycosyltransferase involved in cell wall biosynthesis